MKKKVSSLVLVLMAFVLVVMLSGCGESLSGTYVTATGSEYLEFAENKEVVLYSEGNRFSGEYALKGKVLTLTFNAGSYYTDQNLIINEDRDTIFFGDIAFVKTLEMKSGGLPWWGWALIIFIGLGIISIILKVITGKSLNDNLEKLNDWLDDL